MTTDIESTMESLSVTPRPQRYARIVQNYYLVWLDRNIDESNDNYRNSITKLQEVVNTVNIFFDVDECVDFIEDHTEKVFVIISEEFARHAIPVIQDIPQVHFVYIYSKADLSYEKSSKVCGVYTDITAICEKLKQATRNCDHNLISISYVKNTDGITNKSLDTLDPSFMYTQILKEILLTINFEKSHFDKFITYCRKLSEEGYITASKVNDIQKKYNPDEAIQWYTNPSFLYRTLNRALRTMEADLIINMGFFVRDLHTHIAKLHTEQYGESNDVKSFIVYRGQALPTTDFDQLTTTQGGLISFNNFLSTSLQREESLYFAKSNRNNPDLVGILFEMKIHPSKTTTPFANIEAISDLPHEKEILFSMHCIFRIGQITKIDGNDRLWQVELTLTNDNDPQLHTLTNTIKDEIKGTSGWIRLGILMGRVAQFEKAQELFEMILHSTNDKREQGDIHYQLGCIHTWKANHQNALRHYEKSLELRGITHIAEHSEIAECHNDIGVVYDNMGEYSKALSYYEKALEIKQKSLPVNHPDLATSHSNIGTVYQSMGEYSKALSNHEKALEIFEKALPANHPDLATSYGKMGSVYDKMGEYSKALSYYEKALEIKQKSLPTNHPDLAISHNNIGVLYQSMGEYSKALSNHEKALEIFEKALPANHPTLATYQNNIGVLYQIMGEYSKALSYYEKALEIKQKSLPANHPNLANSHNNIGTVYQSMGEYSKALSYCEKALEIEQKSLPANHPDLATSYGNIGAVCRGMGEYSKALSNHERALEIRQKSLPTNHPDLVTSHSNIGTVYQSMGEYSKALSYYEKALEIGQETLAANHPHLTTCHNNIGGMYRGMGEYSKALSYYEKALKIREKALPENHHDLATSYSNVASIHQSMREYPLAKENYERAMNILKHNNPRDLRMMDMVKGNIRKCKKQMK